MMDSYITYAYHRNGRRVEAQCSAAHIQIKKGIAAPLPEHIEAYEAWCKAQGEKVDITPPPAKEEEKTKLTVEDGGGDDSEADPTAKTAEGDDADTDGGGDESDDGLPEGYTIKQHGKYFSVYGPDGEKVGKGQEHRGVAVTIAKGDAKRIEMEGGDQES